MGRVLRVFAAVIFLFASIPSGSGAQSGVFSGTNTQSGSSSTNTQFGASTGADTQSRAKDPGVRGGSASAGDPLPGLTSGQMALFEAGKEAFETAEGIGAGLGPRFNLDSCAGCHAQPSAGGTSPAQNPQMTVATADGAQNKIPSFLKTDGPVREVRYKRNSDGTRDGGVHDLFVISGRVDTTGDASACKITQPDIETQLRSGNVIFRIPTPTFGTGLIEQIPDSVIADNAASQGGRLGVQGRPSRVRIDEGTTNRNGNDGTIARFGWKAQNKSLLLFSGEAYNVEMGITNELFQSERDETSSCQFVSIPNDVSNPDGNSAGTSLSDVEKFSAFMRFLAPPTPSTDTPGGATSIGRGKTLFSTVGCALCHTPTLTTGFATIAALRNQPVNLFSDLVLHKMGPGLADDILQGQADADEFRTAPLWGLGQRIFFLHDGRTSDLLAAIQAHASAGNSAFSASEANSVIANFNGLNEPQKQDVLNFLRSL